MRRFVLQQTVTDDNQENSSSYRGCDDLISPGPCLLIEIWSGLFIKIQQGTGDI